VHLFPSPAGTASKHIIIDASKSHHHRSFPFCTSHHPHTHTHIHVLDDTSPTSPPPARPK
jgi:hypothetical protein